MTFEEARDLLLKNLELCFNHLVGIHLDWDYCNPDTDEYMDAVKEFLYIQQEIFNLKSLMVVANKTKKDLED